MCCPRSPRRVTKIDPRTKETQKAAEGWEGGGGGGGTEERGVGRCAKCSWDNRGIDDYF